MLKVWPIRSFFFLDSPEEGVRLQAAKALAVFNDARVVPHLMQYVYDEEKDPQKVCCDIVRLHHPEAIAATRILLEHANPKVRDHTAVCFYSYGFANKDFVDVFIESSRDESNGKQYVAAINMGKIGDPRATPALLDLFDSENERTSRAAAEALAKIKDPIAIGPVSARLAEGKPFCWIVLGGIGQPALDTLIDAGKSKDPEVWSQALSGLVYSKIPEAIEHANKIVSRKKKDLTDSIFRGLSYEFKVILDDPDCVRQVLQYGCPDLQKVALNLYYRWGEKHPELVPMVVELSKNQSVDLAVRKRALKVLNIEKDPLSGKSVSYEFYNRYLKFIAENGLNSNKLELEAISLLRQSKAAIAAEQLIGFLDSRHPESVKKAGWALADLGDESVETLLSMLSSEDPYLRWKCAFILGKILERNRNRGEGVNMVITNALENLIDDPSLEVRYIAGLALGESCSKESAKQLSILSNERDPGMKAMANHLLNRLDSSQNMKLEGHPVFISRVSEKETTHK